MKTMKKLWMAASVAAISMTGCQEEQFEGRPDPDNYYASVETFGTDTRTALGEGRSVVWSSEDRIAIFEGNGAGQAYQVLDAYIGKSSGEFAEVEGLVAEGIGASLEGTIAVYPFNEDLTVTSGDNESYIIEGISFPSEQKYIAGSFSDEAFPMTAVCENCSRNLSFKNIGGVLKLSLTGSYSVSLITLTGNSGEPLSGSATVTLDPDGIPSVKMSDDASTSVTLICDPAVQLDPDTTTDFYISIPPTEFETGFTVAIADINDRVISKTTSKENEVKRSQVLSMPDYTPVTIYENTRNSSWSHMIIDGNSNILISEKDNNTVTYAIGYVWDEIVYFKFNDNGYPIYIQSDSFSIGFEYYEDQAIVSYNIDNICTLDTIQIDSEEVTRTITRSISSTKVLSSILNDALDKVPFANLAKAIIEGMTYLIQTEDMDHREKLDYYADEKHQIITEERLNQLLNIKETKKQENPNFYIVGLKAGESKINGEESALLELQGTIIGESNGKTFDFEYGICYSATNQTPSYYDSKVSSSFTGMEGLTRIDLTLPEWFDVSGLSEDKYYYRGFFKDRNTGNIMYSDNVGILEMTTDERWVDLGLSVLWAAYNVGATSPEEYGGYYAWGETSTKSDYTWENYKFYNPSTGYCNFIGSEISGTSYDVAHVQWGGGARMPTLAEVQELVDNCTFTAGSYNGVRGNYVTGPNGNSIFLPFAGFRGDGDLYGGGSSSYFWSGTYRGVNDGSRACYLYCGGDYGSWSYNYRRCGHSVRPVKEK